MNRFLSILIMALLSLPCVAEDWAINLQQGAYGPFRLSMPASQITTLAKKHFKTVNVKTIGSLTTIEAWNNVSEWSMDFQVQEGKGAYDMRAMGSFPGTSKEGLTSKSTPEQVVKMLGKPVKIQTLLGPDDPTYIYNRPNIRLTWSTLSAAKGPKLNLRFVPAGQKSVWDDK